MIKRYFLIGYKRKDLPTEFAYITSMEIEGEANSDALMDIWNREKRQLSKDFQFDEITKLQEVTCNFLNTTNIEKKY